jgi:hypothetical protein
MVYDGLARGVVKKPALFGLRSSLGFMVRLEARSLDLSLRDGGNEMVHDP